MNIRVYRVIVALCFCCISAFAQTREPEQDYTIKGVLLDTLSNLKLGNSTINVLNSKDSILVKFDWAKPDGSFSIGNLPAGKFILQVNYEGYADYAEPFSLDPASKIHDFGQLNMISKAHLLEEILIKGEIKDVTYKGDTTEFNPRAYVIQPNSRVEDLLKQLPEIEIDFRGKITAQGQPVKRVLLDGEEFFGDDPTLVTRNIRSDMVDKIQLYDRKSKQAMLTGIDDGRTSKEINVVLKEDKKHGYFGKSDMGAEGNTFYEGQAMVNAFKGKRKLAAYGTIGNTGKVDLNTSDSYNYGTSANASASGGGAIVSYGASGSGLESNGGKYNGEGIPLAFSGGIHYDIKWNKDKESLNANYKAGSLDVEGTNGTLRQNNLSSGIINTNSNQDFKNSLFRQKLDFAYNVNLNSTSTLKVTLDGTIRNTDNSSQYLSTDERENEVLLNKNSRILSDKGNQEIANASFQWNKRLKKPGRSVSLLVSQSLTNTRSSGYLNSSVNFYNTQGVMDSIQYLDQYKTNNTKTAVFNSALTWSERFSKTFAVILSYSLNMDNNSSDKRSFNQSAAGKYDIQDMLYSNNYEYDQLSNQAGMVFNYNKAKTMINFGTRATAVKFKQTDLYTLMAYKRNFWNLNPQASYQYRFSSTKTLQVSYNGYTRQPALSQIQPIRINTDPLNIFLGNASLKPSYNSSMSGSYRLSNLFKKPRSSMSFSGSYSFTANEIINSIITDITGKNTYQSTNLTGKNPSSFSLSSSVVWPVKFGNSRLSLSLRTSGNTSFSFSNNTLNTAKNRIYTSGISLSSSKQKKYDFQIQFNSSYHTRETSIQKQFNNNGFGFTSRNSLNIYLPGKMQLTSDVDYEYEARTQSFSKDFNRITWNTTLTKKFLKGENLLLSLSGNDLLNQNTGFSRNASNNMIIQNSYTTIKRYFLFSLTWDFNRMGKSKTTK